MDQHVGVGVPREPLLVRDLHAADHELAPGYQRVGVEPLSDSHERSQSARMPAALMTFVQVSVSTALRLTAASGGPPSTVMPSSVQRGASSGCLITVSRSAFSLRTRSCGTLDDTDSV